MSKGGPHQGASWNTTSYRKGDRYLDFTFTKVLPIRELHSVLYELEHCSGAQIMHLSCEDRENLFSLSFRTLPFDSKGTAHILEHIVLCGSKKFPVKDPFFSMTRRSLMTFMNAITGPDFTCYPAASQVEKDFYHLLEVYLDAVFFPNLDPLSFHQEGHRLEFSTLDDPTSTLLHKGVVFNEMKGSLAIPEVRLYHLIQEKLTPDLPYAHHSGGLPSQIVHLTHEELLAFHQHFYHPSRCLFFFYGNLPITKHLECITRHVLHQASPLPPLPPIAPQPRFSSPRHYVAYYPTEERSNLSQKSYCAFGWLTVPISDQQELLALSVLDTILMENDGSPLKYALLQSNLCTQAFSHLDFDMAEVPYILICHFADKEKDQEIEKVIRDRLGQIAHEGIPLHQVEAAMHQLEFHRLEILHDPEPFGLVLFMRAGLLKQYGAPPENGLTIYEQFHQLREKAKNPSFFPSLIQKHFLHNPHLISITFSPDPNLAKEEKKEEEEGLRTIGQQLTQEAKQKLVEQAKILVALQRENESGRLDCLPKMNVKDIPQNIQEFPLDSEEEGGGTVFHHSCFTNHIVYANLIFDLPYFEKNELSYLQLFLSILPQLGMASRNYRDNLAYIQAHLGHFYATLSLRPHYQHCDQFIPSFGFHGQALDRNLPQLFALFRDACTFPQLDEKQRLKELILQIHTSLKQTLIMRARSYAQQELLGRLTPTSYLTRYWYGIDYYRFISRLVDNLDQKLTTITEKMIEIKEKLYKFTPPHLVLSCDQHQYQSLREDRWFNCMEWFPQKAPLHPWPSLPSPPSSISSHAYVIASPVAFSTFGFRAHASLIEEKDRARLLLSTYLLENVYLHLMIREEGGAYGSGAHYCPSTGVYFFSSYRDPHIERSYQSFQRSVELLAEGSFTETHLEEAKFSLIQHLDSPVSPGQRAIVSYWQKRRGKSPETRQYFRDSALSTTKEEVMRTTHTYLLPSIRQAIGVTFASEGLIDKEGPNLALTKHYLE